MADLQPSPVTAAGRYEALAVDRQPVLERARDNAALSIPSLMPPAGTGDSTSLPEPFQSLVADGVNNLAAKMLLTLFPPGASFHRMAISDAVEDEVAAAAQQTGQDVRGDLEKALAQMERRITKKIIMGSSRAVHFEALQHEIVTGNGLIHVLKDCRSKFFPLDQYVVKRDSEDQVLEIVVKECLDRTALDPRVVQMLDDAPQEDTPATAERKTVDLYTWIKRTSTGWKAHQEVCGKIVPGASAKYPSDACPWIVLRWSKVAGCDYGRSRCEEYGGDIRSYEEIAKALLLFTAAAAKIINFVNPAGTTDKQELAEAESGDFVDGDARDVSRFTLEKSQDFTITKTQADDIKRRLERAFMMSSAVQRDAERVTAEEIRAMIGELEQSLGGVYSVQADEFQRPLVMAVWKQMMRNKEIPPLPSESVTPVLVTGIEGLGRSSDLQRLDQFLAGAEQLFGQEALAQIVILPNYLKRRATALGIDIDGLVKSQEQIDQENQAATQAEMTQKLGPAAIKATADSLNQGTPMPGSIPK